MTVAVDATTLLLRSAGIKTYIHHWLSAMIAISQSCEMKIRAYPPGIRPSALIDHQHSHGSRLGASVAMRLVHLANIRWSPLAEFLLWNADIFHASQHMMNLPRQRRITSTIFDFSCWVTPEFHTEANIAATKRYAEAVLKQSDGLIAISAHARNDAIEILKLAPEKIRVIYPGVSDHYFNVPAQEAERVRKQYNLPHSFVLFVGCIEPRKNVAGLIRAHVRLPQYLRKEVPLVLAGPMGWVEDDVRRLVIHPPEHVRYLDYVPEPDLPGLFQASTLFVYPSFYEGFGLPVGQAMAAGVPIITSNRSCLPEVLGDAGMCVEPDSPDQIADAMHRILNSPDLAGTFGSNGKARSSGYRWSTAAVESFRFFAEIAGCSSACPQL